MLLKEEGFRASYSGVAKFLTRFEASGSISRRPGSGRPPKVTDAVRSTIERQMETDNETTAVQLHTVLASSGHAISLTTILRCRESLGWTFRGSAYCQIIREANKAKRLVWAREFLREAETGFLDVIFTDDISIQLESHRRLLSKGWTTP